MTNNDDHKHEENTEAVENCACGENCECTQPCDGSCACGENCACNQEPDEECCGNCGENCECKNDCACDHEGHEHGDEESHEGHDHEMPHSTVKVRKPNTSGVAEEGTLVTVHYTGTLDDGETFDTSAGREPIEFVIGEHQVIRGFEDGITGMKKGDKKEIVIEPKDAYGDVNPELRQEIPKDALGEITPEVGMMLALQHPMAPQPIPVKIIEVGAETITIDLNHPLAGQKLHFALELVELK